MYLLYITRRVCTQNEIFPLVLLVYKTQLAGSSDLPIYYAPATLLLYQMNYMVEADLMLGLDHPNVVGVEKGRKRGRMDMTCKKA